MQASPGEKPRGSSATTVEVWPFYSRSSGVPTAGTGFLGLQFSSLPLANLISLLFRLVSTNAFLCQTWSNRVWNVDLSANRQEYRLAKAAAFCSFKASAVFNSRCCMLPLQTSIESGKARMRTSQSWTLGRLSFKSIRVIIWWALVSIQKYFAFGLCCLEPRIIIRNLSAAIECYIVKYRSIRLVMLYM